MKDGLITLGIGFVFAYLGVEGGMPVLMILGVAGIIIGCVKIGWNFDTASKSSNKSKVAEEKESFKKVSDTSESASFSQEVHIPKNKFCSHCGAKLKEGHIYCIECGGKVR